MKVAIVGFGIEGKSALNYYAKLGAQITVCDQDQSLASQIPSGVQAQLGPDYLDDLNRFEIVVRSAGIHPDIITKDNPNIKDKLTTVINEFLKVCPTKNVIGVTGTKGKGTTTTLITKMLEAAGEDVYLGGNIGLVPLDFLPKLTEKSWVVLELSSFQLSDIKHSPHIAVCLMVVPEHLNWHADMADYVAAKVHMFAYQNSSDIAIYFAENDLSKQIAAHSPGRKIPFYAEPGAHMLNDAIVMANEQFASLPS